MPFPSLPIPSTETDLNGVKDYLTGLIRNLNWLLSELDTLNINQLDAKVINAGILNAALVKVQSTFTGATITLDGTGFKAVYTSGVTITIDQNGFTINYNGTNMFTVNTTGVANFAGNITTNANINVATDVTIGNKLHMNANNFGNGIDWGAIDIYIDPAANALHLSATGGVYANGVKLA